MVKLALDAGHGLPTGGRRTMKKFHGTVWQEWELNARIIDKMTRELNTYNNVQIMRVDDPTGRVDVSPAERIRKIKAFKPDYVLSAHHNAGIGGRSGGGIVVLRAKYAGAKSIDYQRKLYNTLIAHGGLRGDRSNPTPSQQLFMLDNHPYPGSLVEYGFMDSSTDVPIMVTDSYASKMASATVAFIVKEFRLSKKSGSAGTVQPGRPQTSKPSGNVWYGLKSPHNTKAGVQKLQQDLIKLGFPVGSWGANGVMGNDTVKAIRGFQSKYKLTIDGNAGAATLTRIEQELKPKPSKPSGNVWYGLKSPHNTKSGVMQLQKDLVELGFSVGSWGANGVMGGDTVKAIKGFQDKYKLTVDGDAGAATLTRIKTELVKKRSPKPSPVPNKGLFRVRKSWADTKSQDGAYSDLKNAQVKADSLVGYSVYNDAGVKVYPVDVVKPIPPKVEKPVPPKMEKPKPQPTKEKIAIDGKSIATAKQMEELLLSKNSKPSITVSPKFLSEIFIEEGEKEGVRGDIAFCQAMKETGWLKYGGQVLPEQNNYAGIGATNNSPTGKGAWFKDAREGVRAQIQHLKAYSNTKPLKSTNVDPRFHLVKRGVAPNWTDLNNRWAVPGKGYGEDILVMYQMLLKVVVEDVEEVPKNEVNEDYRVQAEFLQKEINKLREELKHTKGQIDKIKDIVVK